MIKLNKQTSQVPRKRWNMAAEKDQPRNKRFTRNQAPLWTVAAGSISNRWRTPLRRKKKTETGWMGQRKAKEVTWEASAQFFNRHGDLLIWYFVILFLLGSCLNILKRHLIFRDENVEANQENRPSFLAKVIAPCWNTYLPRANGIGQPHTENTWTDMSMYPMDSRSSRRHCSAHRTKSHIVIGGSNDEPGKTNAPIPRCVLIEAYRGVPINFLFSR